MQMIMIENLNDRESDIAMLMDFWERHKTNIRFNILPLNPGAGLDGLAPSPPGRVAAIRKSLQEAGFFCETRKPRGLDIDAACGQLAAG